MKQSLSSLVIRLSSVTLFLASVAFAAPKSASAYYGDAAFQYIENRLPTAEITCNEGLQYYPNDQKLQMLLDRIHEANRISKIRTKIKMVTRVPLAPRMTKIRINRIKVRTVSLAVARVAIVLIAMAVPESSNSLNSPKVIPVIVTAVSQNSSRFNLAK